MNDALAFVTARSASEACELLRTCGRSARILAGGQTLLAEINRHRISVSTLIDVSRIAALKRIDVTETEYIVGASVTLSEMQKHHALGGLGVVREALLQIGNGVIRNRSTIGGSTAVADPHGEIPLLLLALGATIEVTSENGVERFGAADFFNEPYRPNLPPCSVVSAIRIRRAALETPACFREFRLRPSQGRSLVSVCVRRNAQQIVAHVSGLGPRVERLEGAPRGTSYPERIASALIEDAVAALGAHYV